MMPARPFGAILAFVVAACAGGGGSTASAPSQSPQAPAPPSHTLNCAPATPPAPTPTPAGPSPQRASSLSVPNGFAIERIANVTGARELAFAPNGDLFVGTTGTSVYLIANVEAQPSYAHVFATLADSPAAGVAFSTQTCSLYAATQFGIYRLAYTSGDQIAHSNAVRIASLRPSGGGDHTTTSLAITGNALYASIGSSCDACVESDPTRATIQQMGLDGSGMKTRAIRIRNAIALTINPATSSLWAGDAGQDSLPVGHPYEIFDNVSAHSGVSDYGWPECEENQHAYRSGAHCAATVIPAVEFPAYSTVVGAAFYPSNVSGKYAFPSAYRGGAFVALHGSWHVYQGCNVAPMIAFVPMNGDTSRTPVNWNDPHAQWAAFVNGFQPGCSDGSRIGRPVGVAVGPQGDLFVADDLSGAIYRIRPQ